MRDKWREVACLAAVVSLPLLTYPLNWLPHRWAQSRFDVTVPLAALCLVVCLVVFAAQTLRAARSECPARLVWPLVAVVASLLISIRTSTHPHFSVQLLPAMFGNLAVFLVATKLPEQLLPRLCWWWVGTAVIVALNGLARLGSEPEFLSTIGNRNFLGAYLAAAVPIGVALWNWRALSASVVLLVAMVFCESRGAWLALAVVGLACLVWAPGCSPRQRRMLRGAVAAAVVVTAFLARDYVLREWRADVRPVIWHGTVKMIAARPILGHGLGTFVIEYPKFRLPEYFLRPKAGNLTDHAHNEFLEITAEQGLVGLAATLWVWGVALVAGFARRSESGELRRLKLGLVAAASVFVLHGVVDVDLRHSPNQTLLWLLLGVLASGIRGPTLSVGIALRSRAARLTVASVAFMAAAWLFVVGFVQPMIADRWQRQARLAEARGDWPGAVEAATRSLRREPLRLPVLELLASVWAREPVTRWQAIEQCRRIEELAPDYADITFNLGQLYLAERQPTEALPYLQRAVDINPYSVDKRYTLAVTLAELVQGDAASAQLRAALALNPAHAEAKALLAEIERSAQGF